MDPVAEARRWRAVALAWGFGLMTGCASGGEPTPPVADSDPPLREEVQLLERQLDFLMSAPPEARQELEHLRHRRKTSLGLRIFGLALGAGAAVLIGTAEATSNPVPERSLMVGGAVTLGFGLASLLAAFSVAPSREDYEEIFRRYSPTVAGSGEAFTGTATVTSTRTTTLSAAVGREIELGTSALTDRSRSDQTSRTTLLRAHASGASESGPNGARLPSIGGAAGSAPGYRAARMEREARRSNPNRSGSEPADADLQRSEPGR
jgi:hypothetical protein